jgi:glycosyltransferase involved in cell wall biosynthesis
VRLGVFADLVYRRDEAGISTDIAFVSFVLGLRDRVDELVVFGRLDPTPGRAPYAVDGPNVRFVPMPHYPSLRHLWALARARRAAIDTVSAQLPELDALWLFGPHPLSLDMARLARRNGVAVVLGVRQDLPRSIRRRLPSRAWRPAMLAVHGLELAFRRLSRSLPTIVVGEDLAQRYGGGRAPLLVSSISLVRSEDFASADSVLTRPWDGPLMVLSVGRLDPEKNPLLLADVLADLWNGDERWSMTVVGDGPLAGALRQRRPAPFMTGEVAYGPALWDLYRQGHVFLHVSLTEGVPQVLFEAMAAGLPIVATEVGGVAHALGDGERGLLVPPRDAAAAAAGVRRIAGDRAVRERLIRSGLAYAAEHTMDDELDRVAEFLKVARSSTST